MHPSSSYQNRIRQWTPVRPAVGPIDLYILTLWPESYLILSCRPLTDRVCREGERERGRESQSEGYVEKERGRDR